MRCTGAVIFPLIAALATPPVEAQLGAELVNRLYSVGVELPGLAHSVTPLGDINNDGYADFAALTRGSLSDVPGGLAALSGRTGERLWQTTLGIVAGPTPFNASFADNIASVGDINNDGFPEILVGGPRTSGAGLAFNGGAEVRSGRDGAPVYLFSGVQSNGYFGSSVAAPGDLNNDGIADAVVCGRAAPESSASTSVPRCRAFSLLNGSVLWEITGGSQDGFGSAVAAIADINNDGRKDLAISRMYASDPGTSNRVGAVEVYSGANGGLLTAYRGSTPYEHLGGRIAGLGDLNGDGKTDLLVTSGSSGALNQARVFSIINGSLTPRFALSLPQGELPLSAASIVDLSRDGVRDIAVGFPYAATGYSNVGLTRIFSGFNGQSVKTIDNGGLAESFGTVVQEIGDVNGDGDPEFGILSRGGTPNNGAISIYSVGNKNHVPLRCGGIPSGAIAVQGVPVPGNTVTFTATVPQATGGFGAFLISYKPYTHASLGVNFQGQTDCRTGIDFSYPASHQSSPLQTVGANGTISFPFTIPNSTALIGTEIIIEGWFLGLSGTLYSPGSVIMRVE
ncbi:MAG: hypothetical protein RL417_696 [Pseudomonadota bacterium]